jgi:DNA-binding NtrC family response regulator
MDKFKVLVVDDEKRVRDEIAEFLTENSYEVTKAALPSEAYVIIRDDPPDIIILDIRLPEESGLSVLKKIRGSDPDIEIIMISGHGDMGSVIEAMRSGASDFFPKPFRLLDIQYAIERTRRYLELSNRFREIEHTYSLISGELQELIGHQLVGNSAVMRNVVAQMNKIARVESTTVMIMGESGTGKELVARGIHFLSNRKKQYFHTVNCSAIPENLFESEFFGHRKGSFTGAIENKAGWFEVANKGTLFLDEIGDMPLNQQAKLLRVLEDRKVARIGSHEQVDVDVRVIAASNQDLEKLVQEKKFRLDLFHRITSFVINIPPLKERKEDIPLLLEHFIGYYGRTIGKSIRKTDPAIIKELVKYSFPGNVRELRNMVERAVILSEGHRLRLSDFRLTGEQATYIQAGPEPEEEVVFDLEKSEKSLIEKALQKAGYNKSKAAELLNISWQSLDRRLKKFKMG